MVLAALFFLTALLYACVGFGGGSTYNALLVLANTDYRILPCISLLCNIVVVSGGTYHFTRAGYIELKRILPWIPLSVPAAWVGGSLNLSESIFTGLLGVALFASGIRMLWPESWEILRPTQSRNRLLDYPFAPPLIGGVLGLLAGLTGIGGGIFLAPILSLSRWADARTIAGTCSLFILVNSLAGLAGQTMKLESAEAFSSALPYWPLFPAVLIGGQIGSWLGATRINVKTITKLTGMLVLYVSMKLLHHLWVLA